LHRKKLDGIADAKPDQPESTAKKPLDVVVFRA